MIFKSGLSHRASSSTVSLEAKCLMDDAQQSPELKSRDTSRSQNMKLPSSTEPPKNNSHGLSTREALNRIYNDINNLLEEQCLLKDKG